MGSGKEDPFTEQDTLELLQQAVGRAVINHQHLNTSIKYALLVLRSILNAFEYGHSINDRIFLGREWQEPLNSYVNQISDSELYDVFGSHLNKWHEFQHCLLGEPHWYSDYAKILMRCLKDENKIRNELMHTQYLAGGSATPLKEVVAKLPVNNNSPNRGLVATNIMPLKDILEYTGFQSKLINMINEFSDERWERGIEGDEDFVSTLGTETEWLEFIPADVYKSIALDGDKTTNPGELLNQQQICQRIRLEVDNLASIDNYRQKLSIKSKDVIYDLYAF